MTTYAFTSLPAPARFKRRLVTNTRVFESSLTGAIQTASRGGEHWELDVDWIILSAGDYADIIAFFARLNGAEHRVTFAEFKHTQRGAYGGTPLVQGASQTGVDLVCDGASFGITDWCKAGDFISYDTQARMVTADASSDGAGNVTIPIIPAIRTSPANNDPVNVAGTETGVFILMSPVEYGADSSRARFDGEIVGNMSLRLREDILPAP